MGRSEELNAEKREKSKAAILEAALEQFAHKGFEKTTISIIAKEAGIAKGLVYNHFQSKELLLEEVVLNGIEQIKALMGDFTTIPVASLMDEMVDKLCDAVEQEFQFWKLYISLITQVQTLERMKEPFEQLMQESTKQITEIFESLRIENAEAQARCFAAMFDGMFLHYTFFGEAYPLRSVGEAIKSQFKILLESTQKKHRE